jgi:hypothetical protein
VTLPRVVGSGGGRRGGVVDEHAIRRFRPDPTPSRGRPPVCADAGSGGGEAGLDKDPTETSLTENSLCRPYPTHHSRERGCQEIDRWLDQRRASFETAASRLPQDEDQLFKAIKYLPHAEERPRGASRSTHGLAAALFHPVSQFPDSRESGNPRGRP